MLFGLDETESLILSISVIGFITIVAGCVSGLTLSLFSIDETFLKVLADGPDGPDKRRAQNILAVTASPHWLLVTLLLTNAAAIESMPMIIDSILNPIAAICISVVLVLVFGEVIPQALFIRHALPIGSFFSFPLRGLMWLTCPISWTVAKILDAVVGHREAVFFRRRELREFLILQQEMLDQPLLSDDDNDERRSDTNNPARLLAAEMKQKISEQEISIMLGALSLSETMVSDETFKYTKLEDVVSLSENTIVDKNQCERLFLCGFSRILVHKHGHPREITGFFLSKMLIKLIYRTVERAPTVKELAVMEAHSCMTTDFLSDVYQALQMKSCHMAVVYEESYGDAERKAHPSSGECCRTLNKWQRRKAYSVCTRYHVAMSTITSAPWSTSRHLSTTSHVPCLAVALALVVSVDPQAAEVGELVRARWCTTVPHRSDNRISIHLQAIKRQAASGISLLPVRTARFRAYRRLGIVAMVKVATVVWADKIAEYLVTGRTLSH
ncbi:membrane-associated protein, putative [Bodo saltans]|uniref:Membrane-associated protein, putative n=1 Tax=Bodo saltans TaxID=75058 RepID=A0A0S4IPI7_BODSA|nr:membrane-associated protein, putative [Bodo saltans]|eukprot:CUE71243.1 membrane-associated protein, putative [Bodo saltans]